MEKREKSEVDTISEWVKTVRSLIQIRIKKLQGSMSTQTPSVLKDTTVLKDLSAILEKFFVVPADKGSNNILFVCKNITLIA